MTLMQGTGTYESLVGGAMEEEFGIGASPLVGRNEYLIAGIFFAALSFVFIVLVCFFGRFVAISTFQIELH
jgi:hypothetical protein